MKMTVRVDDRAFEVEIENLSGRPIVALVEGERFEIWPEEIISRAPTSSSQGYSLKPPHSGSGVSKPSSAGSNTATAIHAPIPGVIISIVVQVGDSVDVGQEVCVLEAMKMKNSIRAARSGEIGTIAVKEGDHVQHHDLLFKYVE